MTSDSYNRRLSATPDTYAANASTYLARHRDRSRIEPTLRLFSERVPPGIVLDLGCGPGFDGHQLRKWGHRVIGMDYTRPALHLAAEHCPGTYLCADMRALPLQGEIAGIWACASLLHLEPEEARGVLRVLRGLLMP